MLIESRWGVRRSVRRMASKHGSWLALALVLAACAGTTTNGAPTTTPTTTVEATVGQRFETAFARFSKALPPRTNVDESDWPSVQAHLIKTADVYNAFGLDLAAIPFPETVILDGQTKDLRTHAVSLTGWSKELAIVLRQIAASTSFEAAMQDTVDFAGSSYPMQSFYQDATGEWRASLDLTAGALGLAVTSP